MRRQARISTGGALVVRSASALQVWLWMLIFVFQNEFRISRSIQPGYLDFDNLPETNFTCAGKVIGGYYADLETSCQMFHVCTVGQQDEPMDIKFLCLNGTVFDQETRVCERVDEVDCTKSEKFYSLNLELYGSTAPPLIQPDQPKPQSTEHSVQQAKPNLDESDPSLHESSSKLHGKIQEHSTEVIDSTEDPIQEVKKEDPKYHYTIPTQTSIQEPSDIGEEYQDEEIDDDEYEEDYSHATTTTTVSVPITTISSTTTTSTTTTTTRKPTTSSILPPSTISHFQISHAVSSPSPPKSSVSPISSSSPNLDPTILSPQEFIYHHRGPGSDAISFQRQSFRPADGVYITHAPPQQFDHFQYESSRTAPRPAQSRPSPFVQRPQPAPFRPTTLDPRDQLLRPGPTSQPSERHETSVKHRLQSYPTALPAQRPLPFNPYYYDRKRSDDSSPENESSLSARSVAPPTVTERPPTKPKSPPRVIVTASASVSDSNGKRLNYTVGNVVSAVKPIVPINYDDYKESDLIFDPFFLDVPKLQKRRKTRSNRSRKIFSVPATVTLSTNLETKIPSVTAFPATSRATTIDRVSNASPTTTTKTTTWNPYDYVDDNYEPHAYIPPEPPLAVLVAHDINKYKKQEIQPNKVIEKKPIIGYNSKLRQMELTRPTSSATQTTSSHVEGAGAAPLAPSPPPPPPIGSHSCASQHSSECQTRA